MDKEISKIFIKNNILTPRFIKLTNNSKEINLIKLEDI